MSYNYNGSFRLRAGTYDADELTAAYEWGAFPRQLDQPAIVDWLEPLATSDILKEWAALTETMDGQTGTEGGSVFTWRTPYLTPFMVDYLITNYSNRAVTVMSFDRGSGWRVFNAWLQHIDKSEGTPDGTGYTGIPMRFVDAIDAPAGVAFNSDFNDDFDAL